MSYLETRTDPAARARAVIVVGGVHALIGAGLVAGLTIAYSDPADPPPFVAKFIDPPKPVPPPDPTPVPPDTSNYTPPVAPRPRIDIAPRPPVEIAPFDPAITQSTITLVPRPSATPTLAPIVPLPTPSFAPTGPVPRNGPVGWISNADYPRRDLVRGNEGTAEYRLVVGSDGRVDACEIVASSGSSGLDRETCRLIERRARFEAARSSEGTSVVGTYTGSVTWQIPD